MNDESPYRIAPDAAMALASRAWEPPLPTLLEASACIDSERVLQVELRFDRPLIDSDLVREAVSIIETEIIADVPANEPLSGCQTRVLPAPPIDSVVWPGALEYVSPIADLVGRQLTSVAYGYTALPVDDVAPFGFDLAEMICFKCGDMERTVWVSEGVTDTLSVGGSIASVVSSAEEVEASDRDQWKDLIGSVVTAASVTSARDEHDRPEQAVSGTMLQAIHLNIGGAAVVTVTGCRPPDAGPQEPLQSWTNAIFFDDLVPTRNHGLLYPLSSRETIPLAVAGGDSA